MELVPGCSLERYMETTVGIVTALNPYIGYANATAVAQEAHASGGSVYDIVLARKLLTREQLDELYRTLSSHPMVKIVL